MRQCATRSMRWPRFSLDARHDGPEEGALEGCRRCETEAGQDRIHRQGQRGCRTRHPRLPIRASQLRLARTLERSGGAEDHWFRRSAPHRLRQAFLFARPARLLGRGARPLVPGLLLPKLLFPFLDAVRGDRAGQWIVLVFGNWRVVFRFEGGEAVDVDLIRDSPMPSSTASSMPHTASSSPAHPCGPNTQRGTPDHEEHKRAALRAEKRRSAPKERPERTARASARRARRSNSRVSRVARAMPPALATNRALGYRCATSRREDPKPTVKRRSAPDRHSWDSVATSDEIHRLLP